MSETKEGRSCEDEHAKETKGNDDTKNYESEAKERPPAKKAKAAPLDAVSVDEARGYSKKDVALAERSFRFCELLKFRNPATARTALKLALDHNMEIDCNSEYRKCSLLTDFPIRGGSRSTAFQSWRDMWIPEDSIPRWTAFEERETMEALLDVILKTGGLNGYKVTNLAELANLFPYHHVLGMVSTFRTSTFMLASHYGLCDQLFLDVINRNQHVLLRAPHSALLTVFGRWKPGMCWPPLRNPMANTNDQKYTLELEASRRLSTPDAPLFHDRVSPLMGALKRQAWGAVYGLLEQHEEIDLLAMTKSGHITSDYVPPFCGRIGYLIESLERGQLSVVESCAPTCRAVLDQLFPSVLMTIVMEYWMPRLRNNHNPAPKERPPELSINYAAL